MTLYSGTPNLVAVRSMTLYPKFVVVRGGTVPKQLSGRWINTAYNSRCKLREGTILYHGFERQKTGSKCCNIACALPYIDPWVRYFGNSGMRARPAGCGEGIDPEMFFPHCYCGLWNLAAYTACTVQYLHATAWSQRASESGVGVGSLKSLPCFGKQQFLLFYLWPAGSATYQSADEQYGS